MSILIKKGLVDGKEKDIYIEDNLIREISGRINVEAEHKISADNKAIIPPMVNSHTHAAMTLLRGYADDMKLQEWLQHKIWPLEAKLNEQDIYIGTKLACLEMIKSGTTFFNDMYWHFSGIARAVEESGIRAALSAVFIDMFDQEKAKEQIKANITLFSNIRTSSRISFMLGPHAIYTVSKESLQWAKEFADKNGLMIHIHLSETKNEVDDCIRQNNLRPVEYLDSIGFLGPNVVAAHCVWLSDNEISLLSKNSVKIAHNPVSNMKLAVGSALPYEKLKKANVAIGLGTDGCSSNNNLDMFESMKFAALLQKHHTGLETSLTAQQAFEMATSEGSRIFNLNYGIKEGMLADLIIIDKMSPDMQPMHNLVSNIVYSANGSCVDTTICDGRILMLNRQIDNSEQIISEASSQIKDIMSR